MARCSVKKNNGQQCRAPALIGRRRCLFHNKAMQWTGRQVKSGAGRYVREKTYRTIKKRLK